MLKCETIRPELWHIAHILRAEVSPVAVSREDFSQPGGSAVFLRGAQRPKAAKPLHLHHHEVHCTLNVAQSQANASGCLPFLIQCYTRMIVQPLLPGASAANVQL